jgi:hypothetical protein
MYDFRQKGDLAKFEAEEMKEWLTLTEHFIKELDQVIDKEFQKSLSYFSSLSFLIHLGCFTKLNRLGRGKATRPCC